MKDQWLRGSLYLFVASIPFDLPNRSIPVDVPSITALLLLLAAIACGMASRKLPTAFLCFLAYLYMAVISTIAAGAQHTAECLKLCFQILLPMLLMPVVRSATRDPNVSRTMLWVFVCSCACRAAVQVSGLATTSLGSWEAEERLTAFGQNPNNASANLAIGLLVLLGLSLRIRASWMAAPLLCGGAAVISMAIVQMGSRGAIISLVLGLLTLTLIPTAGQSSGTHFKRMAWALLVICGFVALGIRSESTTSRFVNAFEEGQTAGRDDLYPALIDMVKEKPWMGWGLVESQYELGRRVEHPGFERRDSHNLFFEVATTAGLFGLIPFLAGLSMCLRDAWRARQGPDGALPMSLLICLMAINLTQDWLLSKLTWCVLGYISALRLRKQLPRRASAMTPAWVTTLEGGR